MSKDSSTKNGAILADDRKRIVATGFNGLPDRMYDDFNILNNREAKYGMVIHAEMNAILNCPVPVQGLHIFITAPPCSNCTKHLIQAGVASVSWQKPTDDFMSRWGEDFKLSQAMFYLADIPNYEFDFAI